MASVFSLFGDLKVGTTAFENSLYEAEARLNQTQKAIADTEKHAERLGQTNARTARTFEKLNDTVEQNRNRMRQAVDAYEKGEISANKLSSVLRQTDTRVNSLNSRLKDTQARMSDVARGTSSLGGVFKQVFSATILAGGLESMTRAVVGFGQDSVKMFASLDKLVRFTSTLDKNFQSPENLRKFREDIQKLSTEIPHSAESIAKASFTLKSAFQTATAPELITFLREFGNAATASNTDIATHTQNLAALAKSYKLTAAELPKFSALIASSFGQALASDAQVAQGFNIILNAARSTKQPLEDMVAAMSTLQGVSADAASNTTLLQNVFAKLTDPKYIQGMKDMGVSVFDVNKQFRPLNDIVNDLAKSLKGLSDQEVTDKLEWAKDAQAREGLKALIRNVEAYNKQLSSGADQQAFADKNKVMFDSAEARLERFTNSWNSAKIEIGAAMVSIVDEWKKVKLDAPTLDTQGWLDVIEGGMRVAIQGAGAANIPTSRGAGQKLGSELAFGIATGIRSSQAFGSISGAIAGAIDWAFGAGQKAQESHSPSERAARELGMPFAQGVALGIRQGEGTIGAAVTGTIEKAMFANVKKTIATQAKELGKELKTALAEAGAFGDSANIRTRVEIAGVREAKQQLEDLLAVRIELGVNVDNPLILGPSAEKELLSLNNLKDTLSDFASDITDFTKNEDEVGKIINLFGDPRAAFQLQKQADALNIQLNTLKGIAKVMATADLKPLGTEGIVDVGTPRTGTGLAEGFETGENIAVNLAPPPELLPAWENFWATLRDRMNGFKASLPSIKESIGVNLVSSIYGIGDVLAGSIARWDGTFKGFFTSIADGFRQMAQSIVADLVRILVYKSLLKLFGGLAGGVFGGGGDFAGAGAGGSFAEGGLVRGPGTTTSDSVFARLSNKEFVMPFKAVKKYGLGMMEAMRSLQMPSLAMASGGAVSTGFVPSFSGATTNNSTVNNSQPIVNNFHFHANQNGQFSKQSAEQATRAMVAQMNRTALRT